MKTLFIFGPPGILRNTVGNPALSMQVKDDKLNIHLFTHWYQKINILICIKLQFYCQNMYTVIHNYRSPLL